MPLFTSNPHYFKQSILLAVKKNDARLVSLCLKYRFVLENMIDASVRFFMFEVSAMFEEMDSFDRVYQCSRLSKPIFIPGLSSQYNLKRSFKISYKI